MRTMTLIATAAVATVLLPAAAAAAPEASSFSHAGRTYVYTQTPQANGTYVLAGYEKGSRGRFHLVVDGTRVRGRANGMPVSFTAPSRGSVTVASK